MKRCRFLSVILCLFLMLTFVAPMTGVFATLNPTEEQTITNLLNQMTLDEKIQQCSDSGTGWSTYTNTRLGIPGFIFKDGPHGTRGGTQWPTLVGTACTWDAALVETYGAAVGKEFRQVGGNVALAPMANIIRDGRWGRASETYSEDPYLTAKLAAAQIRGMQTDKVVCTVKHYACNNIETGRGNLPVKVSERTLREIYTYAFRKIVKESNPLSVMAAYNQINGFACTANKHVLNDMLKNEFGFEGYVISDWGAVYNDVDAANGGTDVKMPGAYNFKDAVLNGTVPMSTLDDKVRRILRAKIRAGMLEPGYTATAYPGSANSPTALSIANQMAHELIVLAKNTGNVLPLSKTATQRIAVVGPYADAPRYGAIGSGYMTPSINCISPLQAIQNKVAGTNTTIVTNTTDYASMNAVIVFVGINDEGEGFDRTNLDLINGQNELVAQVLAAKPNNTIVVYTGGSFCIAGSWSQAPGVVVALYPGQYQGDAIADVLFGDYNPGGKLPVSFPMDASQVPSFAGVTQYEEPGEGRGYSYLDKHNLTPLFPFGHGLSYTTFTYSNLRLSSGTMNAGGTITVQVDVKNTGTRTGDEVAQLYVQDPVSSLDRRVKDLRGFQRVTLTAGQTQTVSFNLNEDDLAYWDDVGSRWFTEPGQFNVLVGSSSRDIRLNSSFQYVNPNVTPITVPTPTPTGARTPTATPTVSPGGDVLVPIIAATASSSLQPAAYSCDNNTGTRWESAQGVDPQWIYWDLGGAKNLSRIVIDWEVASAANYTIQGSNDAANWTTLATVTNSSQANHNQITSFISGSYRYVRMYGTTRTTGYGYSIWEAYIYMTSSATPTPTATKTPTPTITATVTKTPSGVTPTVTKTPTATKTPSGITPTPTVTPTITPTSSGSNFPSTTWYLFNQTVSGVTPAGQNLQTALSGTTGWQPTTSITTTAKYWYGAALTGTYKSGNWSFILWTNNPGSSSTVKVDLYKVNSDGGGAVSLGSQSLEAGTSGGGNHSTTFTFSNLAAVSLSNQRLLVKITKATGTDLTMAYNTNDFPTRLITP